MPIGRSDYEERKERKINAYEERAAKAHKLAEEKMNQSSAEASAVPFGQPIMVGHHSEGKHRALIKRVQNLHRKSIEEQEKSAYYQDKAETASSNRTISGDNPEAVKLYREKLEKLEAAQERMKTVNKAYKKGDAELKALGMDDDQIARVRADIQKSHPWDDKPFPTWALSNNSAEIRRIKEKIETLGRLDGLEAELIKFSGGELRISVDINRVQFIFDDIPAPEIRAMLKSHGFKWARSEGAWQRQRTLNAIHVAKRLISDIEGKL
jgi:hypothetical protein